MAKGFGLQFLNGLGEAQDQTVIKLPDYENKSFVTDDDFTVEEIEDNGVRVSTPNEITETEYKCQCCKAKKWLIFLAGALTGIVVKKLFEEDDKKNKKEDKNGSKVQSND